MTKTEAFLHKHNSTVCTLIVAFACAATGTLLAAVLL